VPNATKTARCLNAVLGVTAVDHLIALASFSIHLASEIKKYKETKSP
jgi:hypothetical protein